MVTLTNQQQERLNSIESKAREISKKDKMKGKDYILAGYHRRWTDFAKRLLILRHSSVTKIPYITYISSDGKELLYTFNEAISLTTKKQNK